MAFQPLEATLRDGRRIRIRAIRPDDRDEVLQAFDRLFRESRYTRFMAPMRTLSATVLDRTLHLQDAHEIGLVAEVDAPDGIDIVAGARYYVLSCLGPAGRLAASGGSSGRWKRLFNFPILSGSAGC
jgi:hypothetical protein